MTFQVAINRLLDYEKGYVNNPKDPGGETKWGLSKRTYPHLNIKDLTRDDAIAIYKRDFWNSLKAEDMPFVVAFQLFDFSVHSGHKKAIGALQRVIGTADDGVWGPISQKALLAQDSNKVALRLLAERIDFLTSINAWDTFGKGWTRRMAQNIRYVVIDSNETKEIDMKFMSGYKTVLFNVLAFGVALTQHYGGMLPPVDPEAFGMVVTGVNFVLRFVTKTPVFKG